MTANILTLLTRRQAEKRPDSIALKGQDEQAKWYDITWRELDVLVVKASISSQVESPKPPLSYAHKIKD